MAKFNEINSAQNGEKTASLIEQLLKKNCSKPLSNNEDASGDLSGALIPKCGNVGL